MIWREDLTLTMTEIDEQRSVAFAERLLAALNGAATMLMTSIGHRTGLFDAMRDAGAVTSVELAERAGLHERYVREWLGAMTVAGIVEHDPDGATYLLPPEHAAWLTRAAAPSNMAVTAQWIPVLGQVEDEVVRCFHDGGGVPYDRFARFHETMAEESDQSTLAGLVDHILPFVPGLIERLEEGIRVADLGCGRGKAILALAARFPRSTFVGYDLSEEAIGWARAQAGEQGLANATFEVRDLTTFDVDAEPGAFDLVTTFDAVHDQAAPLAMLRGIRRSLRPGGVYLMQDIDGHTRHHDNLEHPLGPFIYAISCLHCMTVSLAQGGEGLGAMWGVEKMEELLGAAGFASTEFARLEHDMQNVYAVATA
jgi:SAM-dependent methyltransferase